MKNIIISDNKHLEFSDKTGRRFRITIFDNWEDDNFMIEQVLGGVLASDFYAEIMEKKLKRI